MNKTFNNILFIIISAILLLLEIDRLDAKSFVYQGIQVDSSSYVRMCLSLFFVLSIALIKIKRHKLNQMSRKFLIFVVCCYIMLIIQSLIYGISGSVYLYFSLPVLFYFYFLFSPPYISPHLINIVFPFLFIVISFCSYLNQRNITTLVSAEIATSASYYVLAFLPFMLLGKYRLVKLFAILVALTLVVLSFKRGGLVALLFGVLLYFFVSWKSSGSKKNRFFVPFFSLIVFLLFMVLFFRLDDFTGNVLGNKMTTVFEDGGSNRNDIYSAVFSAILNSDIIQLLFGHGWDSVNKSGLWITSAHNDYLQLIYDLGIISVFLYISYIISLFKFCIFLIHKHSPYASAFACSLGIFFVLTMVSHVLLYSNFFLLFTMFWGFVECKSYQYENRSFSLPLRK